MKTTIPTILGLLLAVSSLVCAVEPAPPIEQVQTTQADAAPAPDPAVIAKVTAKALAGDWKQVLELTEGVDLAHPSPVLKLVRGHACLALNYNNEATVLLFGTRDPQQLQAYQAWAGENLAKNPDQPYAHFFAGDAAARLGKWDEALREFDVVIAVNGDAALAYNARGVAYAVRKDIGKADEDFLQASKISTDLADALANTGYLHIQRNEGGTKGAIDSFSAALGASRGFALAQHGRGCMHLARGDRQSAYRDLSAADGADEALALLLMENEARYTATVLGRPFADLVAETHAPGTSFKSKEELSASIRDKLDRGNMWDQQLSHLPFGKTFVRWTTLNSAAREHTAYYEKFGQDPELTEKQKSTLTDTYGNIRTTNERGGWAERNANGIAIATPGLAALADATVTAGTKSPGTGKLASVAVAGGAKLTELEIRGQTEQNRNAAEKALARLDRSPTPRQSIDRTSGQNLPANLKGQFARGVSDAIGGPLGSSREQIGGARADPIVIKGKWPFVAIYGLGYGILE